MPAKGPQAAIHEPYVQHRRRAAAVLPAGPAFPVDQGSRQPTVGAPAQVLVVVSDGEIAGDLGHVVHGRTRIQQIHGRHQHRPLRGVLEHQGLDGIGVEHLAVGEQAGVDVVLESPRALSVADPRVTGGLGGGGVGERRAAARTGGIDQGEGRGQFLLGGIAGVGAGESWIGGERGDGVGLLSMGVVAPSSWSPLWAWGAAIPMNAGTTASTGSHRGIRAGATAGEVVLVASTATRLHSTDAAPSAAADRSWVPTASRPASASMTGRPTVRETTQAATASTFTAIPTASTRRDRSRRRAAPAPHCTRAVRANSLMRVRSLLWVPAAAAWTRPAPMANAPARSPHREDRVEAMAQTLTGAGQGCLRNV